MPLNVREGLVEIEVPEVFSKGPGKRSIAYYSRSMVISRDLTIFIIRNYLKEGGRALDLLGGSGVRGLRIEKECNMDVTINEKNREALKFIHRNKELNGSNARITECNAERCFPDGFYDYIDIDPYGTPVPFLDGAFKSIRNKGIIGITSTDVSNLAGTNPDKTFYLYHSIPERNYLKHEVGMRILIAYVSRRAAEYGFGIEPLLSYFGGYYYRIFFRVRRGKKWAVGSLSYVQEIFGRGYFRKIGPLWIGNLHSNAEYTIPSNLESEKEILNLLRISNDENLLFFYSTEELGRFSGGIMPRIDNLINRLREQGYRASRTQFSPVGLKTNCTLPCILKILKMKDL
jgi:tRNA (guanine26-N2/guanine27-N2)-dimethyltransferase